LIGEHPDRQQQPNGGGDGDYSAAVHGLAALWST